MESATRTARNAMLFFVTLCLCATGSLRAAELSTAFPKEPPPLEWAPRLGLPFGDHAVFQQNMPVPVWGWTLAVRYAYTQFPVGCNLYNRNGLPASPFSTCGY